MNKYLYVILFLVSGCMTQDRCSEIMNVKVAVPTNIIPNEYWPNENDVLSYYGVPKQKRLTKHGHIFVYEDVQGCGQLTIKFETDAERGVQQLVSAMIFQGIYNNQGEIGVGQFYKSKFIELKPLVIDGHVLKDRYTGIGSDIKILDCGSTIEISWD
jgi:hypothetical protein